MEVLLILAKYALFGVTGLLLVGAVVVGLSFFCFACSLWYGAACKLCQLGEAKKS